MAHYFCERGNHPNPRRNVYWYIGYGSGLETRRSRRRYCEGHWREVEANLSEYEIGLTDGADNSFLTDLACVSCSEPITEDRAQIFVTSYPTKDNRKDYWLQIHGRCSPPDWLWIT